LKIKNFLRKKKTKQKEITINQTRTRMVEDGKE